MYQIFKESQLINKARSSKRQLNISAFRQNFYVFTKKIHLKRNELFDQICSEKNLGPNKIRVSANFINLESPEQVEYQSDFVHHQLANIG